MGVIENLIESSMVSLLICYFCQIWSAYKDQRHDLFLPSNSQFAAAGVAGLIESSSSRLPYALAAPPPQPTLGRLPSTSATAVAAPNSNGKQDRRLL